MCPDFSRAFIPRLSQVVASHGDRPAVSVVGGKTVTYSELWMWSERIAQRLKANQVGPESVVAIHVEKSAEYIAGIIAVWRLRAAWTPLDPQLPEYRKQVLIEDAQPTVILGYAPLDNAVTTTVVSFVDPVPEVDDFQGLDSNHAANQDMDIEHYKPADLAYLIYTSGSTGKPKGVEVTHAGLVPMLDEQIKLIQLQSSSRSLFLLSISFDASISDIGTALLAGACLVIDPTLFEEGRLIADPEMLLDTITRHQITYVDLPPVLLARLSSGEDAGDPVFPECLKTILIGGEKCPDSVIQRFAHRIRLINSYGPTETTVCSSMNLCRGERGESAIIGKPLDHVTYLIDEANDDELLIGGSCVARGYLHRPDLNLQRFIQIDGTPYYRTGDRVRLNENGSYEFLGRLDRQLKIHGHRIEPEEIEAILHQHPMVSEATVFESRVSDSDKRYLSACIVIRNVSVDDNWWKKIRAFIRSQLPEYMVPTKFHLCETLPRNLHGKVDQEQLIRRFSLSVTESMTPSTTADSLSKEVILADAFRSVLNLNNFDTSDSFFDLGGDSLGLFEITEHVRKHGIQVSPQLIARYESVDGICAAIDAGLIGEDDVRSACELRADVSDLLAQVKIPEFTLSSASNGSKCLLLTGATGFLGSRLLANLLAEFNGEIVCLVRGFSDEIAQSRLEARLIEIKKPLNDSARSRLRVIAGDLNVGQLGMKASEYHKLTKEVDHVIHCAAEVNLLSSYERLRPANVSATLELALFVLTGKAKRFDFMSTLSVFVASDKPHGMHLESDTLKESRFIHGGYAQSKWAAEILLRSIPELIASTRYFRIGLLTTDRNTQQSPSKDLLEWLVRGTVELGCYPELDESIRMDVTPVDYAADILSRLVLTQTADNTFHLAHPIGLQANTLFNIIEKMLPNVRKISLDEYKVVLNSQSEEFLQSPTGLTLSRSLIPETRNINHPFNLFQATNTIFDMQHTQRYLNGVGSQPPSVSRNEIIKMLQPICAELTERALT